MAVTTMRMTELIPKNTDKSVTPSTVKPAQGLLLVPYTATEARVSERSSCLGVGNQAPDSRSVSPIRAVAVAQGSSAFQDELGQLTAEPDGTEQATTAPSKTPSSPILKLEACPSFAEQSHKPLWLERHNTLQRAYSDTLRAKAEDQDDDGDCLNRVDEDDDSDSGADSELQQAETDAAGSNTAGVEKYLPGWEIARSGVWSMVESALLNAPQPSAAQSAHADASAHLATVAEDIEWDAADSGPASGPSISGLPSPFHSTAAPTAATSTAALRSASTTAASTSSRPPLQRMSTALNRARSVSRSFLSTPLGLGAALVPSGHSLSSARSAYSFLFSKKGGAGGASKAAAAAAAEQQQQADSDGRHHVAFAAGLAAATSAAAVVSQAAAVAVSGVAGVTSASTAASLALELGGRALQAGGGILVDKVQNVAARHATAAVAELVMGPSSCEVARGHLVNRVQATVAGASILFFLFNLASMSDTLTHLDFEHDFATSAKVVLDLLTSGPALLENCKDLTQIGVMVGLGVAQRNGFES